MELNYDYFSQFHCFGFVGQNTGQALPYNKSSLGSITLSAVAGMVRIFCPTVRRVVILVRRGPDECVQFESGPGPIS